MMIQKSSLPENLRSVSMVLTSDSEVPLFTSDVPMAGDGAGRLQGVPRGE
jgi:hypothetical protein